jgi:hypothetical protein
VLSYATEESRVRTYGVIAVVAVVLAWVIIKALSAISWPEWLVSAPAVGGTYGIVYALFDRVLWRIKFIRAIGLSATVDVSGTYCGELRSTYRGEDGQRVIHPVQIVVQQTWTKICVSMSVGSSARTSSSVSYMAAVSSEGATSRLGYCYRNKANPGVADEDMGDHEGAADLAIGGDGAAQGRYYNSRKRAGSIDAQRDDG